MRKRRQTEEAAGFAHQPSGELVETFLSGLPYQLTGAQRRVIEEILSDHLTAQVEIRVKKRTRHGEQGEVAIGFGSLEELNGLLDKLGLGKD